MPFNQNSSWSPLASSYILKENGIWFKDAMPLSFDRIYILLVNHTEAVKHTPINIRNQISLSLQVKILE